MPLPCRQWEVGEGEQKGTFYFSVKVECPLCLPLKSRMSPLSSLKEWCFMMQHINNLFGRSALNSLVALLVAGSLFAADPNDLQAANLREIESCDTLEKRTGALEVILKAKKQNAMALQAAASRNANAKEVAAMLLPELDDEHFDKVVTILSNSPSSEVKRLVFFELVSRRPKESIKKAAKLADPLSRAAAILVQKQDELNNYALDSSPYVRAVAVRLLAQPAKRSNGALPWGLWLGCADTNAICRYNAAVRIRQLGMHNENPMLALVGDDRAAYLLEEVLVNEPESRALRSECGLPVDYLYSMGVLHQKLVRKLEPPVFRDSRLVLPISERQRIGAFAADSVMTLEEGNADITSVVAEVYQALPENALKQQLSRVLPSGQQ